jgi:G3E family GTPase
VDFTDVLVLHKADLAMPEELARLAGIPATFNPDARIVAAESAGNPCSATLNRGAKSW